MLASVAELVDALDSKSSFFREVRVRFSPEAPKTSFNRLIILRKVFDDVPSVHRQKLCLILNRLNEVLFFIIKIDFYPAIYYSVCYD